jgi:hypothetical protein
MTVKIRGAIEMRWRSKRAIQLRTLALMASFAVILPLFWAQIIPGWVPFALILFWMPLLILDLCPHCGIPLIFKRFHRFADPLLCPNCGKEIR